LQLILKLIEDPESRHHASAVVRDHFNTRPEKS
jgi:hypothetical protein